MIPFEEGLFYTDTQYLGTPNLIACGMIETSAGMLLVDPGPTVGWPTLQKALQTVGLHPRDVHGILLTHIHLDHAGATGTMVQAHPHMRVYVHEIGAKHLVNPTRLLHSAQRIYGPMMDTFWGDFLAVPAEHVQALSGGETLKIGTHRLRVAYTPGHAVHHVSYLEERSGTAFIGDVGGMRVQGVDYILPVTPPPDIHLEDWHASFDKIRAWHPARLFLTHFAVSEEATAHLAHMADHLDRWAERVHQSLETHQTDAERQAAFGATALAEIRAALSPEDAQPYENFGQPDSGWPGLARYWRKRAEG